FPRRLGSCLSFQRKGAIEAGPGLAGDSSPCGAFCEELPPEHPRATESGINPMRDRRGGRDADEQPEDSRRRRCLAALRLAEGAQSLGAVSLPERGPADDELPRAAKSDDFAVLASFSSEQFLELVQQLPLEFEPPRTGPDASPGQL